VPTQIPTMTTLMDDPQFRQYMKRPPRLPANLRTGNPYQIWVNRSGIWEPRSGRTTQKPGECSSTTTSRPSRITAT